MELYASENWDKRPEDKIPEEMTREEFALSQARCVRILRNGDYNKETKQITLWSPNNLTVRNILDLSEGEKNEQGV
jgi:hypothetical protein